MRRGVRVCGQRCLCGSSCVGMLGCVPYVAALAVCGLWSWPLHDIAITNIVWCTVYEWGVGERAYIAQ